MLKQMGLWDEPVQTELWEQLPAAAKEQLVALFARLAVEAARTAKERKGRNDGTEARTRRDGR